MFSGLPDEILENLKNNTPHKREKRKRKEQVFDTPKIKKVFLVQFPLTESKKSFYFERKINPVANLVRK